MLNGDAARCPDPRRLRGGGDAVALHPHLRGVRGGRAAAARAWRAVAARAKQATAGRVASRVLHRRCDRGGALPTVVRVRDEPETIIRLQ